MEFKSLNLNSSIELLFKTLVTEWSVQNCFWMSRDLLSQLNRISRENWLSIESLKVMEHALFPLQDENERVWFWENALKAGGVSTHTHPKTKSNITFCRMIDPDTSESLGVVAFQNEGLNLKAIQDTITRSARHIGFCLEYQEAKNLSYIDDLTALFNQRYLPQVLNQEIDRCQRKDQKFSLLFLDVDYFKRVNDNHGHLTGSQLLIEIAGLLKTTVRSYDPLFRYGGDEFLILLVDTDRSTGEKVAERIRRAIENYEFVVDGKRLSLTVSIGLSVFPDHAKTAQEIVQLADQAMYYGKNKSRNIVYIAS